MPVQSSAGRRGLAALSILSAFSATSVAQTGPAVAPPATEGAVSLDLDIIAKQLDIARNQIQPTLGASLYEFRREAIDTMPQGDNAPFNQVILQAPGVTQDSFGQLHVRGDHANLQFRINGVQLPEGINVFGQTLQTRLANSISLITGSLPAQYGFRTAGILDIQTKTGTLNPGGSVSMYGGSHEWLQPSAEWGGRVGQLDYFLTGEYLHNGIGIENPTDSYHPLHDRTDQGRGFAYLSGIVDPTTRVSLILGTSRSQFQIPNTPGQSPGLGLAVNGAGDFDSRNLNENQRQINHYSIVSLQQKAGPVDFQLSGFNRYSSIYFTPDPLGDLLFNGIAQNAYRRNIATGTQGDGSFRLNPDVTLRAGFFIQGERSTFATKSLVLPTGDTGAQLTDQPASVIDSGGRTGWLYGVYLQEEWKVVPTVTLNFGTRFDVVDAFTHENQISPRFNAVWQPTEETTLHAGYSRYFTPPPLELVSSPTLALFSNTTAAPATTLNNTPKAERSHYFDVGGTQILFPGFKAGVDLYYRFVDNLLDEGQFGAPIILSAFNYAHGINRGAELTLTYDVGDWHFYGNFAAAKSLGKRIISSQFNFDPADLAFITGHYIHTDHDQTYTASAGVAYTYPVTNTRFSADLLYGSGLRASVDSPNSTHLPDYQQVNLSVLQKLDAGLFKGLELRLDVVNLLDQKYQIRNGTGVGVGAPQFGPRRTVLAGLTQRF
jgi:outer membrane receptor protein involved in Fe transport